MRVLFVANTLPSTDISGVGEQIVQLAAGLESQGCEVRILGRGGGGVRGPKLLFPILVVPTFLRVFGEFRPHVVQVHESDGAIVAWLVRTLAAMRNPQPRLIALQQVSYLEEIRAVRTLRSDGLMLGRPSWKERRFRWFKAPLQVLFGWLTASMADRVLAPSRQTASEIERDYEVSDVGVLPNVTGARETAAIDPSKVDGREYFLFVGRLRIRKGVEVLLYAFRRLLDVEPDQRLRIVGGGEHRHRLEETARQLGIEDSVEFLGPCPPQEVPALMASARALVVPSIYEGMPLVIVEAMAAELPVIASRVSGIPEVVEDGETGWLVTPEDIDDLVGALTRAVGDPDEARRRGRNGRQRVASLSTPQEAARQWSELVFARPARGED